ncbi:MAG: hypothetical protein JNK05_12175 [Myxococcales bacterium]|nr:hypothetical protein [Myxococcales bacterium]
MRSAAHAVVRRRDPSRWTRAALVVLAVFARSCVMRDRTRSVAGLRSTEQLIARSDGGAQSPGAATPSTRCETLTGRFAHNHEGVILYPCASTSELARLCGSSAIACEDTFVMMHVHDSAPVTRARFALWWRAVSGALVRCIPSPQGSLNLDALPPTTTRLWVRIDPDGTTSHVLSSDDSEFSLCARVALRGLRVEPTGFCRSIWVNLPGTAAAWLRTPSGERRLQQMRRVIPVAEHQLWLFEQRDGAWVALPEGPLTPSPERDAPQQRALPFDEDKWRRDQ